MQSQPATSIDPPSCLADTSFPVGAFQRDTPRYLLFVEALLEGLMEYEVRMRGKQDAPTPVPAA
jgi:hypothetical protein